MKHKLITLEGEQFTHIPINTALFPGESRDFNPSYNDFYDNSNLLGFSIKKAVRKVSNVASNTVNQVANLAKQQAEQALAQVKQMAEQARAAALEQAAKARQLAEAQTAQLKRQAEAALKKTITNQVSKMKDKYAGTVIAIMQNPAFQDAAIIGITTALGQPGAGLALTALKRSLIDGNYQAGIDYAMEEGGLSPEDMQWLNDSYNMVDQLMLENQDLIKQESFDVAEMFPGQNVPNTILKVSAGPGDADHKTFDLSSIDKKYFIIGGVGLAAIIGYLIYKK